MGLLDRLLDASVVCSYDRTGFARHARRFAPPDELDLGGRLCLVTGANSGIGFATARGLLARGARVDLLCRSPERGGAALDRLRRDFPDRELRLRLVDMSSLASVRRVAAAVEEPVFRLVHNAGCLPGARVETDEGLELSLATNLIGPFLLTELLRPRLEPGARVVFVASGGLYGARLDCERLRDPPAPYDGVAAYAQAKRAMLLVARRWSAMLAPAVRCESMHPGWVDTRAVRTSLPRFWRIFRSRLRDAEEGADTVIWLCATRMLEGPPGSFWFDRAVQPDHLLRFTREDAAERDALWAMCRELAGLATR